MNSHNGEKVKPGDYVLATKYSDGDPGDQWAVGWLTGVLSNGSGRRYMVADENGNQFRGNGFRRCQKITREQGAYICKNLRTLEAMVGQFYYDDDGNSVGKSVWDFLAAMPK